MLINGRYETKGVLGRGGMGVVFQATDLFMAREVAVKTMHGCPDQHFLELFKRECNCLAMIAHPNIVEIFEMGEFEEDGIRKPYFVMPLLRGFTLHDLLNPPPEARDSNSDDAVIPQPACSPESERAINIIRDCCRGLQAAHEQRLLHRDIKPAWCNQRGGAPGLSLPNVEKQSESTTWHLGSRISTSTSIRLMALTRITSISTKVWDSRDTIFGSLSQYTAFATYGLTSSTDVSMAVPSLTPH